MLKEVSKENVSELVPTSSGKKETIEVERMRAWLAQRLKDAQSAPVVEIVTLTPVLAKLLLDKNPDNRPISETQLERLMRDLASDRWEFNGETIVVAKTGELNNGQHRCRAVVETGRSLRVVMVFGPDRQTRLTIDTGVTRTVGHFLRMVGHSDTNALAAVAANVWQFKNSGISPAGKKLLPKLSSRGHDKPTKQESLMVVEKYRDIPDSLHFVSRKGVGAICSKTILAFCHWALRRKVNKYEADEFFEKLITGNELRSGSAILYCRNRLIEMRGQNDLQARAELIFRAWNAYRTGQSIGRITLLGYLPELET